MYFLSALTPSPSKSASRRSSALGAAVAICNARGETFSFAFCQEAPTSFAMEELCNRADS
ncbi:hypothetical protein [Winkia neuii]|uniref:hypothetical protein n=1 Tax=Winkia neuii TaxID=33007 RepID=UPI0023AA0CC6|nr:hypothetical protein [Winkia neuii]MDU5161591.1 hypothetical protein [Winkia neuii]WEB56324.1 hypothetical protein PUW65_07130 [Winkia neuii]